MEYGRCINISCLSIAVVAVLTMGIGQAVFGAMNLNACPAQPKLPALMLAAGVTAALYPFCLMLIGWLFPCGSPNSLLRHSVTVFGIAASIAVFIATITLNVFNWFIYEREFTVVLNTELKSGPSPRGPNPAISLADSLHPRYCSGQLISAVHITCSPVFLLVEAAFFLLPVAFVGFFQLRSSRFGTERNAGFEKLKNQVDRGTEKVVLTA